MSARAQASTPSSAAASVSGANPISAIEGWAVRVRSPARLSFTLIDLNGETGRKNGMASLAVASPELQILVTDAKTLRVVTDDNSSEHAEVIKAFAQRFRRALKGPPARFVVESGLPPHSGFGSKTTTLLCIGKGYAALNERSIPTEEIAFHAGRAGTSGGSVNLTDRGGFIVDGGHQVAADFAQDPKRYLVPSRYAGAGRKPPLLISSPFPPWPILMILPAGEHIHGQPEADFFRTTLPIPLAEARKTAHLVFMNLAPAIIEGNYLAFCDAFNRITFDTYFKQRQIELQNPAVRRVIGEARRNGIDAIGMSSMGPGCFSFTRNPTQAVGWLKELQRDGVVANFWFTRAANHAALIERAPNWNITPAA